MAIVGANVITSPWDKGLVLELLGVGITTAYQYTEVVAQDAIPGSSAKFPPMQWSGQSRHLALYCYLNTAAGSPITRVVLSVEVCYGDPTAAANWAQVLSRVHQGPGPIDVNSSADFGAAPKEGTVLITCTEIEKAKHLRIGAKADTAGVSGDILRLYAVAW